MSGAMTMARTPVAALRGRILIVCCVALAYASRFRLGRLVLGYGLNALGNPPYQGFRGMFLPHLLLYTTLPALIAAVLWAVLIRMKLLPPIPLGRGTHTIGYGMLGAAIAIAATLVLAQFSMPAGSIRWIGIKPWGIAGNIFSNFYEEFVFRAFALAGLTVVFGFWPAALLSSAMWAFTHTQYPLSFQLLIGAIGIVLCWIVRKARSLWAPYISHEIMDTVLDALIG